MLELGSELISSDIIAFYELIKNAFDAGTESGVEIRFTIVLRRTAYLTLIARTQDPDEDVDGLKEECLAELNEDAHEGLLKEARKVIAKAKTLSELSGALGSCFLLNSITVTDTGSGMSLEDLTERFLVVGTASRKRDVDRALERREAKTPFLGEKGIGRLSAMRLGQRLRVETARRNDKAMNLLEVNWADFADLDAMLDEIEVVPKRGGGKPTASWSGTNLVISDLSEDWTEARLRRMVDYDFARITDPFLDPKERPRIVLFWNEKRLTIPWMPPELLKHAHARVHGEYRVVDDKPELKCTIEVLSLGFEHPKEEETVVVSKTDLEAALIGVSREVPDFTLTTVGPFRFEMHWYNRRRLEGIEAIGDLRAVREEQERWSGVLLFRDGFRVLPYGDDADDWLGLDRKALRRSGYTLNKTQFVGRAEISRTGNPQLVDQTNREGLRETPEQRVFLGVLQYVIEERLFGFMRSVERQYKGQKIDLTEAKSEVSALEDRAKSALKQLRKVAGDDAAGLVEEVQQALFEFSEFAERARERIAEVEKESRQLIDMAGVGLMVEVVAHELARASEVALENLESLRAKAVPSDIRGHLESLRAQMKSLSKRVRVLDPLSVSGRQRSEVFDLGSVIDDALEAHENEFKRHEILVEIDRSDSQPIRVRAVKGMIVQILENLISNSKYWLRVRRMRDSGLQPRIKIALHNNPPTMIYDDNGAGISPDNREKVFRPFFSLKEKDKRRGLGLFIARECAEFNNGTLELSEKVDRDTKRLHRFVLELPKEGSQR